MGCRAHGHGNGDRVLSGLWVVEVKGAKNDSIGLCCKLDDIVFLDVPSRCK